MHTSETEKLRIASLESRRGDEMRRLIERAGGVPHVSPSMREVPLQDHSAAINFANRLMTGLVDTVILMTGVGVQHLMEVINRHVPRDRFLTALADVVTIARGPKVVAALKGLGLEPTYRVPEPNTWRDLLEVFDRHISAAHQRVAVQEYGLPNRNLTAALEARGADVLSFCVYRWELPEDTGPLEENVRAIAAGEREAVLITSANQLTNLYEMADRLNLTDRLTLGLQRCVLASIGPTASEAIRDRGLDVDFEPSHPKMGHLVTELLPVCRELLAHKRTSSPKVRVRDSAAPPSAGGDAPWRESLFMKACRREPVSTTPIWLMRQAGRYLPEYRAIRSRVGFLELCKNPTLCAQVMVETVQRLGVDAAIIFSDLLPILEPMGMQLEYAAGEGPVIHNPLRVASDVDRVWELESLDSLDFVMQTVRQTRQELPAHLPVIGFAGAPFTLASYMMEGGSSRHYLHTKTFLHRDPGAWHALMERLARAVTLYLQGQVAAGAQCVQLFDSWAGCLAPDDYRAHVLPYVRNIVQQLNPLVPVINFATGNPALLPELAAAGPAVVGVDWRIRLDQAWTHIGPGYAVQGNLDPAVLLAPRPVVQQAAGDILRQAGGRPGHIFNLGHGVLPQTPVDHVLALIDAVRQGNLGA